MSKKTVSDIPSGRIAVNSTEAAQLLGICPRTLTALRDANKLPYMRIGRRVLYPIDGLKKFAAGEIQQDQPSNK